MQNAIKYAYSGAFRYVRCSDISIVDRDSDGKGTRLRLNNGQELYVGNSDYHEIADYVFDRKFTIRQPAD